MSIHWDFTLIFFRRECGQNLYELTIVIPVYAGCFFNVTSNNRGVYNWLATVAGNSVVLNCVFGGFNGTESTAMRLCNESLQDWEDPNLDVCFTEVTSIIQRIGEVAKLFNNLCEFSAIT